VISEVVEHDADIMDKVESRRAQNVFDPFDKPAEGMVRLVMEAGLQGIPGDMPLPFGYRIEQWCEPMIPAYAAALAVSFSDSPDVQYYPRLASREGCESLIRDLADLPGFFSGASWLLFFNREPCAILLTGHFPEEKAGQIRVMGVAPRHRNVGVGKYLVNRALWAFRDRRLVKGIVKINRLNRAAIRFFRSCGFQASKSQAYK
jgi:GNAT superfamily N-acetyltransferase